GEGGMGTVYEAEQLSPRRLVALKAIRRGFASRQMLRRFQQEAHILGCLQHPGIAQIYDAGAADDGADADEAYFVMELVRGSPLTQHARSLSVRDRLALIADVCDAVHHAHQRGIIHRDLKPGNILVDPAGGRGRGQPKVLDFGVARTSDNQQPGETIRTIAGQMVGTLSYMSPEQIAADPDQVDVRSDVYSLGVILYQVLAERLPHDLRDKPIHEAARMVCEDVPARLGTIDRSLRGEIETIVARAIEKDKARRYQSAADLGEDIRRYLDGYAIEARKDSTLYVLRKQMIRHKAAVAVALATILGVVLFALYAVADARRSKTLADTEHAANALSTRALRDVGVAQERADREAAALRVSLYASRISVAQAAFLAGDAEHMRSALDACGPDQRGWEWRYLRSQADQSERSIECFPPGTARMVLRAGPVPDCGGPEDEATEVEQVYASQLDGFVAVLNAATGNMLSRFRVPDAKNIIVHDADPTAGRLALVDGQGFLSIRSVLTGALIDSWNADAANCRIVEYSGDGKILLTATNAGVVRLWDVATHAVLLELTVAGENTICAFLSPDGKTIVTAGTGGVIRIWNARSAALMHKLRGHDGTVLALACSADGRFIVSGGEDSSMRVWEAQTGRQVSVARAHVNKVTAVALSANGQLAASGGTDSTVRITNAATGREIKRLLGHASGVSAVAFTRDAAQVVSSARDGTVRWWRDLRDPQTPTWTPTMTMVRDGAFAPDAATIAIVGDSSSILIYNIASRTLARTIITNPKPTAIYTVAYSMDGSKLFSAGKGGSIVAWDPRTGLEIERRKGHAGDVYKIAVSPATGHIASAGSDHTILMWPADPSQPPTKLEGHTDSVLGLAWFGDGSRLVSGSADGTVRVWNAATGTCQRTLKIGDGRDAQVHSLALADADSVLICGTASGRAEVWDTARWEHLGALSGHKGVIHCIGTSPDGTRVATGSFDTTVRVWDIRTRSELLLLPAHLYQVLLVRFSADGSQLVTSGGGKVKFWIAGQRH
ncbi:MAG: protein kinase, partial [Pyrinomonadaceae bacterium]|nr:protein kinase [Phycisphaerales bacterium]